MESKGPRDFWPWLRWFRNPRLVVDDMGSVPMGGVLFFFFKGECTIASASLKL